MHVKLPQSCPTLGGPMDYSQPGSSAMRFFRQEYWSGLSFPPPGDLPDPETEPVCLVSCIGKWFLTTNATWEANQSSKP